MLQILWHRRLPWRAWRSFWALDWAQSRLHRLTVSVSRSPQAAAWNPGSNLAAHLWVLHSKDHPNDTACIGHWNAFVHNSELPRITSGRISKMSTKYIPRLAHFECIINSQNKKNDDCYKKNLRFEHDKNFCIALVTEISTWLYRAIVRSLHTFSRIRSQVDPVIFCLYSTQDKTKKGRDEFIKHQPLTTISSFSVYVSRCNCRWQLLLYRLHRVSMDRRDLNLPIKQYQK